jgi:hypothetical protein
MAVGESKVAVRSPPVERDGDSGDPTMGEVPDRAFVTSTLRTLVVVVLPTFQRLLLRAEEMLL